VCELFSANISSEEKMNRIKERCRGKARDNYSAYLIPIQDVEKMNILKQFLFYFMY
jgi:protein phosphatase